MHRPPILYRPSNSSQKDLTLMPQFNEGKVEEEYL